ncbi:MAG: nucleoside triphosphate pyrophosphohydrolase [Cytophagales bacterium]|tara:strand:- start:4423 stop:5199 length:777 start_codon:yes stop_codon:yes gene_type:complete
MKREIKELESLIKIIRELRRECPWDRNQTIKSLRPLTIEEVYELSDAIINTDNKNIEEELGDLLLHIIFYAQIGSEKKSFNLESISKKLSDKLIERHPHVYGKKKVRTESEVKESWEMIKQEKRKKKGTLNNIPSGMPAMTKSMRIQEKVKSVGFDWDHKEEVVKKIYEELSELKEEINKKNNKKKIKDEIGDLIFSVINMARFINIDPEEALESTNKKFIKRFQHMEDEVKENKKSLKKMTLEEMNNYWEKSKKYNG